MKIRTYYNFLILFFGSMGLVLGQSCGVKTPPIAAGHTIPYLDKAKNKSTEPSLTPTPTPTPTPKKT